MAATLLRLKQENEALYDEFLEGHTNGSLDDKATRDRFNARVDSLLASLKELDTSRLSISEYRWLSSVLLRWQSASVLLKKPRYIEIPPPPSEPPTRAARVWTQEEIESWLRDKSYEAAKVRRRADLVDQLEREVRELSSDEARLQDWHQAKVHFAREVLLGRIDFSQTTAGAYLHLEEVWLDEVKDLMAYFLWKERGSPSPGDPDADYREACSLLDQRLREGSTRCTPTDFAEARAYLEKHFLTDGKLDLAKRAHALVESKAQRLWQAQGSYDELRNWATAETYARAFYENVVPAVLQKDKDSTRAVVEALQGSPSCPTHRIANCFEMAVAITFLDRGAIPAC